MNIGNFVNNKRCKCCNKVSSQDIETDVGDFSTDYFTEDQNDNSFICKECSEWHDELMSDYEAKDDPYGWQDDGFEDLLNLVLEENIPQNDNEPPPTKDD